MKATFETIQKTNPAYSSYTCFAIAITGKEYLESYIEKMFGKLVERRDYSKTDRESILAHLFNLNRKTEK
jgi:hypothetical protein